MQMIPMVSFKQTMLKEPPMDKIFIKDLRVNNIIGIYDYERTTPQEMIINVNIYTDIRKAAETDNISECVDYEKVANIIRTHAQTAKRLTVEALAEDIARLCLAIPRVERVNVKLEKTQALAFTASVGVEIERTKPEFGNSKDIQIGNGDAQRDT
jgi:FolB domain-containing protein